MELDPEAIAWLRSRPDSVLRAMIRTPPGRYRLQTTGQHVILYSYTESEDGECRDCTVLIYAQDNPDRIMEPCRRVFGISLSELEPIEVFTDAALAARTELSSREH